MRGRRIISVCLAAALSAAFTFSVSAADAITTLGGLQSAFTTGGSYTLDANVIIFLN